MFGSVVLATLTQPSVSFYAKSDDMLKFCSAFLLLVLRLLCYELDVKGATSLKKTIFIF
jgi:hypothetical protein